MNSVFSFFQNIVVEVYRVSYMGVFGIILCLVLLWTILMHILRHNSKYVKCINCIIGCCFITIVLIITVINRSSDYNIISNFRIYLIRDQGDYIRPMLMNILLFSPFGVTFPYWMKGNKKERIAFTLLSAFFFSLSIEILQLLLGRGYFEISDIIMNVIGTMFGMLSYLIYHNLIY